MFVLTHLAGFGAGGSSAPVGLTYVTTATNTTDTNVYTFAGASIGTAETGRIVIVAVSSGGAATTRTLTGVTIGGNAATQVVNNAHDTGTSANVTAIFALQVDAGTTADIVATFSGNMNRCAISVYRLTGATGVAANDTASAGGTADSDGISDTINVPAGGGAVSVGVMNGTGPTIDLTGLATADVEATIENANNAYASAHEEFATAQSGLTLTLTSGAVSVNSSLAAASWGPP